VYYTFLFFFVYDGFDFQTSPYGRRTTTLSSHVPVNNGRLHESVGAMQPTVARSTRDDYGPRLKSDQLGLGRFAVRQAFRRSRGCVRA
jgi:hypothetical protein